jgi:uncharacterized protein (UPF0332 family)
MNFDWSEYLNIAKESLGRASRTPSLEARQRNAISRAYYATFHAARRHLRKLALISRQQEKSQDFIIDCFMHDTKQDWSEVGMVIDRLRTERVKADYYDDYKGIIEAINEVLRESEGAIHKIKML